MNCAQITPKIFVGPAPCDHDDFQSLKAKSVTAILSLLTQDDADELGMASEDVLANAADLAFRNVPVTDFDDLDLKRKLPACVAALDDLLKEGHIVFVHCTAGVTRSPTVVVAYLHWRLQWSLDDALNHLQEARSCCPRGDLIELALRRPPSSTAD